ncbi:MAG: sulfite exporter TauE/SafE family protein [Kordiimonas sp.]
MEHLLWHCQVAIESHGSILLSLFLAGLIGSPSHCVGMCGPFVMAQVANSDARPQTMFERVKGAALLPYHLGRITTYIALGVIGAVASQYLVGTPVQRGIAFVLLSLAGVLFVANAVPGIKRMLGFNKPTRISGYIGQVIGKLARPFFAGTSSTKRWLLGVVLGFLPCGLVMAAVMAVASTGDPVAAALAMAAFGLGTIPALFLIGNGTEFALKRWPAGMQQIATGMMAINGVSLIVLAGGMVL